MKNGVLANREKTCESVGGLKSAGRGRKKDNPLIQKALFKRVSVNTYPVHIPVSYIFQIIDFFLLSACIMPDINYLELKKNLSRTISTFPMLTKCSLYRRISATGSDFGSPSYQLTNTKQE